MQNEELPQRVFHITPSFGDVVVDAEEETTEFFEQALLLNENGGQGLDSYPFKELLIAEFDGATQGVEKMLCARFALVLSCHGMAATSGCLDLIGVEFSHVG